MILKASNISKSFQEQKVLSNINLSIAQGQSVAICGRSGEGKTTLLHILGTLEAQDSGILEIDAKQVSKKNSAKFRNEKIGFIFQSYSLLEDFTALENVLMPAKIARKNPQKSYGVELLKMVGLEEKKNLEAKFLSGGEKQRVAIARALCNQPKLILADEPTGNLDRENAETIGNLLFQLVRENKIGLILVTHDLNLANMCQKKYELSGTHLIQKS